MDFEWIASWDGYRTFDVVVQTERPDTTSVFITPFHLDTPSLKLLVRLASKYSSPILAIGWLSAESVSTRMRRASCVAWIETAVGVDRRVDSASRPTVGQDQSHQGKSISEHPFCRQPMSLKPAGPASNNCVRSTR